MDKTSQQVIDAFWDTVKQTKHGFNSEIRIVLSWRYPDKVVPIIRVYPNYQKVLDEITIKP